MSKLSELQEHIREMAETNARAIEAADKAGRLREVIREEAMYGPFAGGDPRDFTPDFECATAEEILRHKQACERADAGEGLDRQPHCSGVGDGSNARGVGFGLGVTMAKVRFLQILDEDGKVLQEFA